MKHFKICPSLFSPAEHFVPHVHILQWCASCRSRQLSPGDGIKVYPEVGNPDGNQSYMSFLYMSLHFSAFICISLDFTFYILRQFDGVYRRPMDAVFFNQTSVVHPHLFARPWTKASIEVYNQCQIVNIEEGTRGGVTNGEPLHS